MGDLTNEDRVVLKVGIQDAGERGGVENLLATPVSPNEFRLILSPGFVQGFAAGDIVRYDEQRQTLGLVERGGNVNVQFFHEYLPVNVVSHIKNQVESVGGRVDGELGRLLVFTFPLSVGVANIQNFVTAIENTFPVEWQFANLFSESGEPLEWWRDGVNRL